MLYEVAILEKPTKKDAEDNGAVETLVFGPKAVVAADAQGAAIIAVLSGADVSKIDKTRMQVLVRPFA